MILPVKVPPQALKLNEQNLQKRFPKWSLVKRRLLVHDKCNDAGVRNLEHKCHKTRC